MRRRDRNVPLALALLLSLTACEGEPEAEPAPDAGTFCNPSREECGFCGTEGRECCWVDHARPEDTRPAFYCIDGSDCVVGGTGSLCWPAYEPPDAAPAPTCGALHTECCAIDAGGGWCGAGLECGYEAGIWQCVGSPS